MPSTPQNRGKNITAAIWNTKVRRKEIAAETRPLLSAVKKEEPKIANPEKRKEKANIEKACTVTFRRFWS